MYACSSALGIEMGLLLSPNRITMIFPPTTSAQDVTAKVIDQLLSATKHVGRSRSVLEKERERLESLDQKTLVQEWSAEFPNAVDAARRLTDRQEPPARMLMLLTAYDMKRVANEPTA